MKGCSLPEAPISCRRVAESTLHVTLSGPTDRVTIELVKRADAAASLKARSSEGSVYLCLPADESVQPTSQRRIMLHLLAIREVQPGSILKNCLPSDCTPSNPVVGSSICRQLFRSSDTKMVSSMYGHRQETVEFLQTGG